MKSLSPELIAVIATGVALAGLLLVGQQRLESRLIASQQRLENRLIANQHRVEDRLLARQDRLEDRLLAVEKEQALTNALLEDAGLTPRARSETSAPE